MTEFVTVNGKKYQTSGYLSGIFSYTPDYIGKLAREEKILGIQIERQWYIEPTSLEVYLKKIAIEKELQKEALRQKRKNERLAHERTLLRSDDLVQKKYRGLEVASQAFVILVCGVFIGGLGWIAVTEEMSSEVIALGAKEAALLVGKEMKPLLSVSKKEKGIDLEAKSLLAQVFQTRAQDVDQTAPFLNEERPEGTFTVLPVASPEVLVLSASPAEIPNQIQFSDEVRITADPRGGYYLEPVFKQEEVGDGSTAVPSSDSFEIATE